MTRPQPSGVPTDRAIAAMMARTVLFVVFIGSGLSLALWLSGSNLAGTVCPPS